MMKQTLVMLLGAVVTAGCSRVPGRILNVTQSTSNGHISMVWTLAPREPLGVSVVASDPRFSFVWTEQPGSDRTETWDTIVLTVGDEDGVYKWHVKADVKHHGRGRSSQASDQQGPLSSLTFGEVRAKGKLHPGDSLAQFVLLEPGGSVVSGVVKVVSSGFGGTQQTSGGDGLKPAPQK